MNEVVTCALVLIKIDVSLLIPLQSQKDQKSIVSQRHLLRDAIFIIHPARN